MGTKVTAVTNAALKPDFAVTTVAAGSFTLADNECAIWVGATFAGSKVQAVTGLKACLAVIRENGTLKPAGANESYAEVAYPATIGSVNSAFNAAATVPEETKVGIWYGPTFQAETHASITAFVHRLIEVYQEQIQKAA